MPWGLLILLATGLLLSWLLLVLFTFWILSHPPRRSYAYAVARNLPGDPSEVSVVHPDGTSQRGLPFTEWSFVARGRSLPVWDVTGLNPAGPTIILTHGWGDSRVVMLPRLIALAPLASRIILWDLPAHGDAPAGSFTLGAEEHRDLLSLYEKVAETPGSSPDTRIVLHGFSLGAGISIHAAHSMPQRKITGHNAPAAVIAESPYRFPITPARNVLRMRAFPYRTNIAPAIALLRLRFGLRLRDKNFDRAALRFDAPLLILHGALDPICPIEDARAIATAHHARLIELPTGAHNNLWTDPTLAPQSLIAIRDFLSETNQLTTTIAATHSAPRHL
jgi:pimeloyl-ACP methyl ester carboxylesterase